MVEVRARTRPAPAAEATPASQYPTVVGGPKRRAGWLEAHGFPVFTEGQRTNRWPYVTNSHLIGTVWREHKPDGSTIAFHAYRMVDGQWRYMGKVKDRDDGRAKIKSMHERAERAKLQPVAPRARTRPGQS